MELPQPTRRIAVTADEPDKTYLRNYSVQLLIFIAYMSSSVVLALYSRNAMMFYYNNFVQYHFTTRDTIISHGYEIEFENINSVEKYWTYINNTFLRAIHEDRSYALNSPKNRRYLFEANHLMGPPRIVQKRIHPDTCIVDKSFKSFFKQCHDVYSPEIEVRTGTHLGTPFMEFSSFYHFRLHSYTSGGFVQSLTYDYEENKKILNELITKKWVDSNTRLVLFELTLYNDRTRLFHQTKLIGEFTAMGAVKAYISLTVTKKDTLWTEPEHLAIRICVMIFAVCVIYLTMEKILQLKTQGRDFVHSVWNILESINLVVIYMCFGYQCWHAVEVERIMRHHNEYPDIYENIDVLVCYNRIYMHVNALSVFTAFMKIFKFFTFNKSFMHFGYTLLKAFPDIFGFTVIFSLVFLTYSTAGYLLFGSKHADYHDMKVSVFTTMRLMVGEYKYYQLEETHPIMGPCYACSYILIMFFFFVNMFLTIISDTYVLVSADLLEGKLKLHPTLGIIFWKCIRKLNHWMGLDQLKKKKQKKKEQEPKDTTTGLLKMKIVDNIFENTPADDTYEPFNPKEIFRRFDERITKISDVMLRMQTDSDRLVEQLKQKRIEMGSVDYIRKKSK